MKQNYVTLVLHHVRYVLVPTRSLLSVGQLDEAGFHASFSLGGWKLHKGNLLLAHGPKTHSLYPLYVTLREGDLFLVDIPGHLYGTEDSATWAKPPSRIYLRLAIFPSSPSRIISSVSIASMASKLRSHTQQVHQENRTPSIWSIRTSAVPCRINLSVAHHTSSPS